MTRKKITLLLTLKFQGMMKGYLFLSNLYRLNSLQFEMKMVDFFRFEYFGLKVVSDKFKPALHWPFKVGVEVLLIKFVNFLFD